MEIEAKRQHQESAKPSRTPSPEPTPNYDDEQEQPHQTYYRKHPPSPPVPTHPIAPVAPDPTEPQCLAPCNVCGRTFYPNSLTKHVKICEKMAAKKRKMFDSSRQRREGTDFAQYLPKNFGIPETSPAYEKPEAPPAPKPAAKPKISSVKSSVTKPAVDLSRCPHCQRTFGSRAFERHVDWCADKAKILPAASAQPPPHIATAKNRLNARTQYKAPPVGTRGRRSSQTRERGSNSRSTSVESREVTPPRDFGGDDQRERRTRAPESISGNDCNDESFHVPVIKSRANNPSNDASVKARQARLARDLSNSTTQQDPNQSSVNQSTTNSDIKAKANKTHQSTTNQDSKATKASKTQSNNNADIKANVTKTQQTTIDPDTTSNVNKTKPVKLDLKKEQQLKKLEELSMKYKERQKVISEEKSKESSKQNADSSQIPLAKARIIKPTLNKDATKEENKRTNFAEIANERKKSTLQNNQAKTNTSRKVAKNIKLTGEKTMSLDSLEDNSSKSKLSNRHHVDINTELLCPCVPCVIHADNRSDSSSIKPTTDLKDSKIQIYFQESSKTSKPEFEVELLFMNPSMTSSNERASIDTYISTDELSQLNPSTSTITNYNLNSVYDTVITETTMEHLMNTEAIEVKPDTYSIKSNEDNDKNYEIEIEHDNEFEDSIENQDDNMALCRHGSGDTYTKFTENATDLDEFMTLTDQMLSDNGHDGHSESFIEKQIENVHTPNSNSLEAFYPLNTDSQEPVNKSSLESEFKNQREPEEHQFSDTFEELKHNLKALLQETNDNSKDKLANTEVQIEVVKEIRKVNDMEPNIEVQINVVKEIRKVNDMEHITVYEHKKKCVHENKTENNDVLTLPSIIENNKPERKVLCTKKTIQNIFKSNRKYKLLGYQDKNNEDNKTFIKDSDDDERRSMSEEPPIKLPRIENKRLDDNYDPFALAARQMKELMSSETNLPKKLQNSCKDPSRTLPILRTAKEKPSLSYLRTENTKSMKDSLNKTYQKTPTLQRMKSFGSAVNENNSHTFGSRCSSFRLNRNDKKPSQRLNSTFTKSSKENISTSTAEKNFFNRSSNLNRSFSSHNASAFSTPKPKDKIPKITSSMYHSFQRTTIKQPHILDKIQKVENKKDFVNLDAILADDNSLMTDSNYIDPKLINENDNLPINVNTILNNPDIISSMESLLTTENLPAKFESFNSNNIRNNNILVKFVKETINNNDKVETNNIDNKMISPKIDDLSVQYDKIMSSLEQSVASKTSIRDDDSLCEDFDLEEFITSFDDEIHKQKEENKRTCSSTTRVVKQAELADSNKISGLNSISSSPKIVYNSNGFVSINKSNSLNFGSNNIVDEIFVPSSMKRSPTLLDNFQKKTVHKEDVAQNRHKTDMFDQDIMQSLKEFDKFYESERIEKSKKESAKFDSVTPSRNGTAARRASRVQSERKKKLETVSNGHCTPNGRSSDSAYSSLNRMSPSKLSICTKETNGLTTMGQVHMGSDSSGCHKDDRSVRSGSSDEFLAMERSAEKGVALPSVEVPLKMDTVDEKRTISRTSSRHSLMTSWRPTPQELSSSSSESLHRHRAIPSPASVPRPSRFCHECGAKFPLDVAKFCVDCGVKRLVV